MSRKVLTILSALILAVAQLLWSSEETVTSDDYEPCRSEDVLFAAELQYDPTVKPVVAETGRSGKLIGSGKGTIHGAKLNGTIRWSLFEVLRENACDMNIVGYITPSNGSEILLDAKGYGKTDNKEQNKWKVAAKIHFETDNDRYSWLSQMAAKWVGEFDEETGRASYKACVVPVEKGTSGSADPAVEKENQFIVLSLLTAYVRMGGLKPA